MSQASQYFARKSVAVAVIVVGVMMTLWGAGQFFQGNSLGKGSAIFGLVIIVAGYGFWKKV